MEEALRMTRAKNTRVKLAGFTRLYKILEPSRNITVSSTEATSLVECCVQLLKKNNNNNDFRVSQCALKALTLLPNEQFELHLNTIFPALVIRLNDRTLLEQVLNKNTKVCASGVVEKKSEKEEEGLENDDDDGEDDCVILDDDECVILDGDPEKPVKVMNSGIENDDDELVVDAEKGQVACRDYPHPRHLCARFPFNTNAHEKHCDLCHCYVCDTRAPCVCWGTGGSSGDHCHSTDKEKTWRKQRGCFKQGKMAHLSASKHFETTPSVAPTPHPTREGMC